MINKEIAVNLVAKLMEWREPVPEGLNTDLDELTAKIEKAMKKVENGEEKGLEDLMYIAFNIGTRDGYWEAKNKFQNQAK